MNSGTKIGSLMRKDNEIVILQDEITGLYEWADKQKMTFNIDKCSFYSVERNTTLHNCTWNNSSLSFHPQKWSGFVWALFFDLEISALLP